MDGSPTSRNSGNTGGGCGKSRVFGSSQAEKIIAVISRSTQKRFGMPVVKPPNGPRSTKACIPTRCAIASPRISLYRQDWVVYLKRPFGGPQYVLRYLGRYTHRVAISNHRLVSFDNGQVTFRYRDSADHNKQKLLLLALNEFLCRFLLHILPQSFVRIRHFGFLANRRRSTLLPLCFRLLGTTPQPPAGEHSSSTEDAAELYRCPNCGGPMKLIERLTAAEILLRSPPQVIAAA